MVQAILSERRLVAVVAGDADREKLLWLLLLRR